MRLPQSYLEYISNGGITEFELAPDFGHYIILEPLDLIDQFNTDIEIKEHAPNYIAFGSDGGGEVFAFDSEGAVYMLPMIGMSPDDASKIATSWSDFETHKIASA